MHNLVEKHEISFFPCCMNKNQLETSPLWLRETEKLENIRLYQGNNAGNLIELVRFLDYINI